MPSYLHERLRAARENAALSQAAVAACCGVKRGAVTLWESDNDRKRTVPSLAHIKTVAELSGVPLWWLVDDAAVIPVPWQDLASNDPDSAAHLPTWANLSGKHRRLAYALEAAAKADAFPPDIAGGMADILESMTAALKSKR